MEEVNEKISINPDQNNPSIEMKNLDNNVDIIKNDIIDTTIESEMDEDKDVIESVNDTKVVSENSAALSNNAEMTQNPSSTIPEGKDNVFISYQGTMLNNHRDLNIKTESLPKNGHYLVKYRLIQSS